MTTASDTAVPADTEPAVTTGEKTSVRDWCCGTAITDPHLDGCPQKPSGPIDYNGPAVVVDAPAEPTSEPTPDAQAADPAKWVHEGKWDHQWLDFKGDRLAVKTPRPSVANSVIMLRSPLVSEDDRGNIISSIIASHLSHESWGRVQFRNINPDETEYTIETIGELLEALVELSVEAAEAEISDASAPAQP